MMPQTESVISCENHAGEDAVACCTLCGRPVCGDCSTSRNGVFLCDASEVHPGEERWSLLMLVEDSFEADMICTNLKQAGTHVKIADPRNFIGTLGFRGRLAVRVLVMHTELESARDLLESSHLINSPS